MRRTLRRISVLLLLAFCSQQLALAGYLCPQQMPQSRVAGGCHDPQPQDAAESALCEAHCNPAQDRGKAAATFAVPSLPPAMSMVVARLAVAQAPALPAPTDARGCDPPPMLRFCTLLI